MKETLQSQIFKGQNKTFTSQGHCSSGNQGAEVNWPHWNTFSLRILCFLVELWEREFMQLHHIDLWETEERWGENGNWAAWKWSKIRSLKKYKSIGLHRKTWWIWGNCVGHECGQKNTGNTVRSNLSKNNGCDLILKTHKNIRTAITVKQMLADKPAQACR